MPFPTTTVLNSGGTPVTVNTLPNAGQDVKANSLPIVIASDDDVQAKLGIVTETAPATDTASSGLNGRLQRVAQRLTSLIALLPSAIGQTNKAGSLSVAHATDDPLVVVTGTTTDAAVVNGAAGSVAGYLRAIKDGVTSTAPSAVELPGSYKFCPASSVTVCGAAGATGDYLSHLRITPQTTSPGSVILTDGAALSAPTISAISTATTGGTLAAATYYYKVTWLSASGETLGSNELSQVTTGTTSTVSFTISAAPGGTTSGRVYRGTAAGSENVYYSIASGATSFTDTGAASTGGSPPATNSAFAGPTQTIFVGGASSVSNLVPFNSAEGGKSAASGWHIITGANVVVAAYGLFT